MVPSLSLSVMSISSLFLFLIIDLETLTTLIPESIPGQTQRCLIAICLSQQVLGKAWQVWHAGRQSHGCYEQADNREQQHPSVEPHRERLVLLQLETRQHPVAAGRGGDLVSRVELDEVR